jgi:hypothetical protein
MFTEYPATGPQYVVKVWRDEDSENPRQFANGTRMVHWHRRSNLGDDRVGRDFIPPKGSVALAVHCYEHGGIALRTGAPFADPWDSGQVGWIYLPREEFPSWFGVDPSKPFRLTKARRSRVLRALEAEVKAFNQWVDGDVWGITWGFEGSEEHCGGFYGDDLEGMRGCIDRGYEEQLNAAWERRFE